MSQDEAPKPLMRVCALQEINWVSKLALSPVCNSSVFAKNAVGSTSGEAAKKATTAAAKATKTA